MAGWRYGKAHGMSWLGLGAFAWRCLLMIEIAYGDETWIMSVNAALWGFIRSFFILIGASMLLMRYRSMVTWLELTFLLSWV
jgi:hypothetical protein